MEQLRDIRIMVTNNDEDANKFTYSIQEVILNAEDGCNPVVKHPYGVLAADSMENLMLRLQEAATAFVKSKVTLIEPQLREHE